jgi:GGDEF domain-containing protein
MTGCGREEAESRRTELQNAIQRIVFEPRPGQRIPLTIAAGVAVFPHDGETYEALLAKADSRMYKDKSARKSDPARQLGAGGGSLETPDFPRNAASGAA